jgi:hypothetical protein
VRDLEKENYLWNRRFHLAKRSASVVFRRIGLCNGIMGSLNRIGLEEAVTVFLRAGNDVAGEAGTLPFADRYGFARAFDFAALILKQKN